MQHQWAQPYLGPPPPPPGLVPGRHRVQLFTALRAEQRGEEEKACVTDPGGPNPGPPEVKQSAALPHLVCCLGIRGDDN